MKYQGGTWETHLERTAKPQHGAFTRQQALEAGMSPRQLHRRVLDGRVVAIDRGVYRHATTPESWQQRLIAACLAGPAVASHRSAGLLWDFPTMPSEVLEVTALRHRRRKAADVIWHESYHLTALDITELDGIAVTRPVRTFLDLGWVLTANQLEEVLNEGLRRNLLSVPAVWQRLEELGLLRPGAGRVRKVLRGHVPGQRRPESVLETRFLQLIRAARVPEPVGQHEVRVADQLIARIDFAYPELKLAIELDGKAYHFGERAECRDRGRENALVALHWRVLRFDWEDVTRRPDYVIATLRGALRATA
jgi:very-short-patch-repair endonuclease